MARARPQAVVFVTPDPNGRGGMAAVVRGLLASPLAETYDVHTITTHRVGPRVVLGLVWLRGMAALAAWCVRHPHGIVHVHAAVRGSLVRKASVILLARALRHPVVVQVHAGPGDIAAFADRLGRRGRAYIELALRRAQVVVSVSDAGAKAMQRAFGPLSVGVIPNAAPSTSRAAGVPDGHTILYLGGFANVVKGGAVMARALPRLLDGDPRARVILAGPGDPPPEVAALIGDRVEWRGWMDDAAKAKAIEEAAVIALPSLSEGLPIVLLEAMSHGRGIVATRVGGIPDTITDGVDGVLVQAGDDAALADGLLSLVRDPARVQQLGAAARRRVEAFGASEVIDRLDMIYSQLGARCSTTTSAE